MHRFLLTGGAGFIGSHVTHELLMSYPTCHVVVLDIMDYCASEKNLTASFETGRCELVKGDIRNLELLRYLLATKKITHVLHFAACSHVDRSFGNSLKFTSVNTLGSHTLLEAMRLYQQETKALKRIIMVSTDEVYGSNEDIQCDENQPHDATNPYSASKAAMECICRAYIHSYKLPIIITRSNNLYGTCQYSEKVIPKFIRLMLLGRPLPVHGSGQQRRSFMHVKDVARAFVTILKHGSLGEYNIEAGEEMTVIDVAHAIGRVLNMEVHFNHVEDRAFNDQRYYINGDKLRALGWAPQISFEEGIQDTVQWYRENQNYFGHDESALEAHPVFSP